MKFLSNIITTRKIFETECIFNYVYNTKYIRYCVPDMTSECDYKCNNAQLRHECISGKYRPIVHDGFAFRNIYCLYCNGFELDAPENLTCLRFGRGCDHPG